MASFKDNGRGGGPKRRPDDPRRRRSSRLVMESLENRRLLATTAATGGAPTWHPSTDDLLDGQHGPLAIFGNDTVTSYKDYNNYEAGGGKGAFQPSLSKLIEFSGTSIGIDVRGYGDFNAFQAELKSLGMSVLATDAKYELVEGYFPLANLPQLAADAQTVAGLPIYRPVLNQQGISPNQSDATLNAPQVRSTKGVDGTGQKVGVISDSVNQVGGGLATSVKTGDLPANVQVIQDGPSTGTDEGRAMLEQIYDIAPGAGLAFATGDNGEAGFATNIQALYNAGAKTIVDDLTYFDEPYYQDGVISQAVNTVVGQGATYLSSAANISDSGYESEFRGVNATVGSLGAGRYMNFDPTGATTSTQLGINVYAPTNLFFQFDQPYYTTNGVTSNVEIDVLNPDGTVFSSGNSNTIATQTPFQSVALTVPKGLFTVVVKVDSGPDPGHIFIYGEETGGSGGFSVDHKFGSAGNTYYPTTHGHNAAPETISVGAVPFWGAQPYTNPSSVYSEPFSSFGPEVQTFDANGNPIAPKVYLKPDISAPDGNNTSFFGSTGIDTSVPFDTANPPYPGSAPTTFSAPTTATNQSVPTLPNFFGTSSAAPNLAAVVALIKQAKPNLTRDQILANLISTATPMNNATKGTWTPQGGYGLANAIAAVNAVQGLQVVFISPGASQTITTAPTSIQVEFSQPVKLSSVSAANLTVTGPNGATVTVGQPVGVDDPNFPTFVRFPITITPAPGTVANGIYHTKFVPGSIVSQAGVALTGTVSDQFNLQQVQGPTIKSTSFVGRIVNIQFNEAVNPATVTAGNIYLFRNGGINNPDFNPNGVIVSQLPGAKLTYNPATFTVTIDLTGLAQSSLPTDSYGLVVNRTVTDLVGNPLNGAFKGVFPSGTNPPQPAGSNFVQDLKVNVQPPIVSYLALAPASDSGIQGDNNTNVRTPSLVGQITAKFPGTLAGVLVYAEFNGIAHAGVPTGGLDLALGSNGRGFVGHYDVQAITNSLGQFTINYPAGVTALPEGLNRVRVVVVGQPDQPPFPGLSSTQDAAFRIDETLPFVGSPGNGVPATSVPQGANINSLTALTLNIIDPVNPQAIGNPFAVDPKLAVPALNPTLADNVQNYKLYRVNGINLVDESSFISTATFVSTSARVLSSDPYTGQVNLTFLPGLPTGNYRFLALSAAYGTGLTDAAGNPFGGYPNQSAGGSKNYELDFNLQPTPTYITDYEALTPDPNSSTGFDNTGVRASYELPVPGITPRAPAPPSAFTIDFSNPLNPNTNYTSAVQLVRSANSSTALPDGNFGDLGITNTSGYTAIQGITVTLENSVPGAVFGQYGFDNRLLITLPAGLTLPADYYRVYLPNNGQTPITDVYGNQLDGEFLGYQNSAGKYVDQLPTGQVRGTGDTELPDLTGNGSPGGAFMTGFVVVPNGNIIYARADALYNPQIPSQTPDGSQARPYPVLAPEAVPTLANGGDLNSVVNSGTNFDKTYDRSGDGQFEPSAFFAAQQKVQANGGPVVILAEQSIPSRDQSTGQTIQKPFVLQAPSPSGNQPATIANDASAAIPAMTTLDFQSGTILKMQNAALLVQNQGSALQVTGGPNSYQTVTVTSYKDSSVGGVTNGDPNSVPSPGDYGGIVFRNFSQAALPGSQTARSQLFPGQIQITGNPLVDNRLKGQFADPNNPSSQADAISGADDIMSSIAFLTEKFAGGAVPQTVGIRYDGITLINSRPAIVDTTIAEAGGAGSAQAGLSVNYDSLRADDVAQGPLIRNDQFINNGLNGIYVRAEVASGVAQATNSIQYPTNPTNKGGSANYVFNDPYPYLLTSKLAVGQELSVDNGSQSDNIDRLYITPGMLVKFETGAWIEVGVQNTFFGGTNGQGPAASLVVGDPTYINEYDANNLIGPTYAPNDPLAGQVNPNFKANSALLAKVVFTSFNDNAASTSYFDPVTQTTTTIVQPLPALPSSAVSPAPAKGDWGGIQLDAGSRDTINSAIFRDGGGLINTAATTIRLHALEINPGNAVGAFISVTNNQFVNNVDVPINMAPDALLATDPSRPLNSGAPFIHGNLLTGNDYNAVGVKGGTTGFNIPNVLVNSVWAGSDFTYLLRDTIVLGPSAGIQTGSDLPGNAGTTLLPEKQPNVVLTLQSTLPGTILADGTTVAAPGVPLVIKLQNPILPNGQPDPTLAPPAPSDGAVPAAAIKNSYVQGAGFVVGIDNGIDPTADPLIDPGAFSQIRIVGIGANQKTGQSRVPVVITSIHDSTVGTTVNGVQQNQVIPGDTTAPKGGDGGVIYFGANSLTDYNLLDPRDGSVIDNADIRYITRIEQQGGGLMYGFDFTNANAFTTNYEQLFGIPNLGSTTSDPLHYIAQYNQPKQITVSNSNLSTFSDIGFYAHPGYGAIVIPMNFTPSTTTYDLREGAYLGEPTHTFFVNDTFTNMPTGVEVLSENAADAAEVSPSTGPYVAPAEVVFLNDTFYNDPTKVTGAVAIHAIGGTAGFYSHVALLAMDSIFDGFSTAVMTDNQTFGGLQNEGQNQVKTIIPGQLQYNLFFNNTTNVGGTNPVPIGPMFTGDPAFRDPSTGNYLLLANSAAIDRARSEIGPTIFGDMLFPAVTVDPANLSAIPIRNEPFETGGGIFGFGPIDQTKPAGDINFSGGLGYAGFSGAGTQYDAPYFVDIVTLPGESYNDRSTVDQWVPVLQSSGLGTTGPGAAGSVATYAYEPIVGERDQAGNLRMKDPNSPNLGSGSRPVFDLGAFEYIIQNPPVVDGVSATTTSGTTNIYSVGGIAGTNKLPSSIQVQFNERLDPTTLNGMSVILLASGGDGIFGNGNSPADRAINLSGKLTFNPSTDVLTIDTSGIFTSTASANDEYRIVLKGTGSSVIRDNSGLALDGINLDAAGNQLALPSGADNFPGSDFQVTFTIDTNPPGIAPSSFKLDPASDTSGGKSITRINLPTFDGTITDIFPPTNFLQGQSVHIDISSKGDGVFDILDAGVGTTDVNGNFKVTLTKTIPDTPNTIGAGGIKGASGATYAFARVRVIDQAGNPSDLPTDPFSAYQAKGAAAYLEVDTVLPKVASVSPAANTVATVNANGQVTVTVVFNENIKTSSLNANSVLVQRTGGTGSFATPVAVPIVATSFTTSYSTNGFETVTFAIAGPLTNDQYRVVLKGTGANPVTDIAANPLDGQGTGTAGDYNSGPFVVYSASQAHLIYVQAGATGTGTQGTRENPFTTIAAAMKAALVGDDVLVLPGSYVEDVILKPGVRLLSASLDSSDTSFFAGSPYSTFIYGASPSFGSYNSTVSINGATPGIPTEVGGLSIISPLFGDPNFGTIDPTSNGILASNSDALIDRNLIINAGIGLNLGTKGANAPTSQVFDNVIAGNVNGIGLSDNGSTTSLTGPFRIFNNDIVDNTMGLYNVSSTPNAAQALVFNNIFFANHDLTTTRSGAGIASYASNTLAVGWDLFFGNGPSNAPASQATGVYGSINPSKLSSTPDAYGNLLANPFFAQVEDPRPNGDSPAVFFNYSNFDLTSRSLAINAANNSVAAPSDFLYRTPVQLANHGFPGTGPASIGAFYFGGKTGSSGGTGIMFGTKAAAKTGGGIGVGGGGTGVNVTPNTVSVASVGNSTIGGGIALGTKQFSVVTTSLSDQGTVHAADATGGIATEAGPTFIDVNFSDDIKASSLSPADLVLSGSGLNPSNPAKATSLAWIDDHAIRFFLSGGYNSSGTVNVSIPQGSITDVAGAALVGFKDTFQLGSNPLPTPATPASPASPTPLPVVAPTTPIAIAVPVVQPVAASAPVAVATPHKPTAKQIKQHAAQVKAQQAAEAKAKAAEAKAAQKAKKTR